MRRPALVAALGLILLGAAPATADDTAMVIEGTVHWPGADQGISWVGECRLHAVQQESATGQPYEGMLVGAAVAYYPSTNQPAPVDVRCLVRVNGTPVSDVDDMAGIGADTAAGRTTFSAGDTDVVQVCIGLGLGLNGPECGDTTRTPAPPQEVQDLADGVLDPFVCPVTRSLYPGVPGVVDIDWYEGDIYVLGQPVYDCWS